MGASSPFQAVSAFREYQRTLTRMRRIIDSGRVMETQVNSAEIANWRAFPAVFCLEAASVLEGDAGISIRMRIARETAAPAGGSATCEVSVRPWSAPVLRGLL